MKRKSSPLGRKTGCSDNARKAGFRQRAAILRPSLSPNIKRLPTHQLQNPGMIAHLRGPNARNVRFSAGCPILRAFFAKDGMYKAQPQHFAVACSPPPAPHPTQARHLDRRRRSRRVEGPPHSSLLLHLLLPLFVLLRNSHPRPSSRPKPLFVHSPTPETPTQNLVISTEGGEAPAWRDPRIRLCGCLLVTFSGKFTR
jgi:hypothetical protein